MRWVKFKRNKLNTKNKLYAGSVTWSFLCNCTICFSFLAFYTAFSLIHHKMYIFFNTIFTYTQTFTIMIYFSFSCLKGCLPNDFWISDFGDTNKFKVYLFPLLLMQIISAKLEHLANCLDCIDRFLIWM